LLLLILISCGLTTYFIIDTYLFRTPSAKQAADGTTFVLRLRAPPSGSDIKAGAEQLLAALNQVEQQSVKLRSQFDMGVSNNLAYRAQLRQFSEHLAEAQKIIQALSADVTDIQHRGKPGVGEIERAALEPSRSE
jgi:hypothetical protein